MRAHTATTKKNKYKTTQSVSIVRKILTPRLPVRTGLFGRVYVVHFDTNHLAAVRYKTVVRNERIKARSYDFRRFFFVTCKTADPCQGRRDIRRARVMNDLQPPSNTIIIKRFYNIKRTRLRRTIICFLFVFFSPGPVRPRTSEQSECLSRVISSTPLSYATTTTTTISGYEPTRSKNNTVHGEIASRQNHRSVLGVFF